MSGQTDIFSYSQGKRDIGHSKFDMSFTNLRTQNFGQLLPVAVYETLPDDFWNVGSDGVTLLKPLTAPAFTSIKQHFYAFYTRNQQVWKHWNNFITNGTEMNQVYGSNFSNQNAESPWKVPYIPAVHLQRICKIAHGYSITLYEKNFSCATALGGMFSWISSCLHNASSGQRYDITDLLVLVMTFQSNYGSLPSSTLSFYQLLLEIFDKYFFRAFYLADSEVVFILDAPLSYRTAVQEVFKGYDTSTVDWSSTYGVDNVQSVDVNSFTLSSINVFSLSDDCASECVASNSPFLVNQITEYDAYSNVKYKSFECLKRRSGVTYNTLTTYYNESGVGTAAVTIYDGYMKEKLEHTFWGNRYVFEGVFYHDKDAEDHWDGVQVLPSYFLKHGFNSATDFYWSYRISDSDEAAVSSGPWKWTEASKAADDLLSLVPTLFGGSTTNPYKWFTYSGSNFDNYPVLDGSPESDLIDFQPFESSEASLNGYDQRGWLWYLCRNSAQLLDSMHIPDIALATRSYAFYAFERFNALPFMAYSHIWEDHFRNRAVSSPEFDYSGVNGSIYSDSVFLGWLDTCKASFAKLPTYAQDVTFANESPNSWSLHFDANPRNGLADQSVVSSSRYQFLDGTRHYFNISSSKDVFALLTGYGLQDVVLYRLYQQAYSVNKSGVNYSTFSELFTKNFYLPNYYNGLLHCKYQNFNKDYFTSGMLDPMSGANDLSLGSTISELRVSEIKQSWFERIAQNRTVRKFMQRIFGITPIEEPKESRLLGVDHVPIKIGEVIQTSGTTPETPQGQRTGLGGGRGGSGLVHDRMNEHGWLIILSSFTVESQYMQGLERTFDVKDSYMDYPTIDFAHIGNESVFMKELNFDGPSIGPYPSYSGLDLNQLVRSVDGASPVAHSGVAMNPWRVVSVTPSSAKSFPTIVNNVVNQSGTGLYNVFSYLPRYSSYKIKLDEVHGEFRDELLFWHTFRRFHTMPMLSHSFVNWEMLADDNEFNRLFAVTKDDVDAKFCCSTFFNASVSRALPYVCVPKSNI